jgi:hypothetical protein
VPGNETPIVRAVQSNNHAASAAARFASTLSAPSTDEVAARAARTASDADLPRPIMIGIGRRGPDSLVGQARSSEGGRYPLTHVG